MFLQNHQPCCIILFSPGQRVEKRFYDGRGDDEQWRAKEDEQEVSVKFYQREHADRLVPSCGAAIAVG